MKKRIILSAVLSLAALANSFACTNLIVGKNASTDGSTIVSYSACLLYTSPSPRDGATSRMPSSA